MIPRNSDGCTEPGATASHDQNIMLERIHFLDHRHWTATYTAGLDADCVCAVGLSITSGSAPVAADLLGLRPLTVSVVGPVLLDRRERLEQPLSSRVPRADGGPLRIRDEMPEGGYPPLKAR